MKNGKYQFFECSKPKKELKKEDLQGWEELENTSKAQRLSRV